MRNIYKLRAVMVIGTSILAATTSSLSFAQTAPDENESKNVISVVGQRQAYVGDIPVKDMPQNVQSLSASALKNLNITQLASALDLVSGVSHLNNFGGLWDAYAIRGFAGDANNVPTGFLVNGFNARGFSGPRDTSSVERIDVLKGPTSALFGRGEPGGTVNIVTKKPEFTPKGSVQFTGGSWNFYRAEGDYTAPITSNLAFRINGAYENAKSYRDYIHTKKVFLSPSLLWNIGDKTSLSYELEYSNQKIPFDRGIPIYNNNFTQLPASRYLGEPGDGNINLNVLGHQLQLQHDFNDKWSLLVGGSQRTTHLQGTGEYPELVASRQPYLIAGSTAGNLLSRQRRYADYKSENIIGRAELTGHVDVAGMANTLVVGVDYDYFKLDQYQTRSRPPAYTGQSNAAIDAIDVNNPVYGAYALPDSSAQLVYNRLEKDFSWGTYFYDQVDLASWLKVRAGGRYDDFIQHFLNRASNVLTLQHVTKFSPQAGIVVEPTHTVSIYSSFGRGFRPNNGADVNNRTFQPETSESIEVGAKYLSPNKKISTSVALYSMKKTNILTSDPANSGYLIAVGAARSRGVEFDFSGHLPYDFNLLASYAYTDAHWTSRYSDPDFAKPILPGDPLIGVAKNSGNIQLTRDFTVGTHKASFGGGVQYIGQRLGETATDYYLPSATLVKLLGSADITDRIHVTGTIDNLFNVRWFSSSYSALWTMPGSPRSFRISAGYRF